MASRYKQSQYLRVEKLIENSVVFNGDPGNGIFSVNRYRFVLSDSTNNLYGPIKDDCLDYFEKNNIGWWRGKLTNHPLSSQVACLNHLFPIREDREAVLSIIKSIAPNIVDVIALATDKHKPAYIQFEAASNSDHLNEGHTTRGSHCTSIDALILGKHKDGRNILFPVEWKYVESYGNQNKANGAEGAVRKKRYTDLINNSRQLVVDDHTVFYYEPFYQLMRQTLWSEQIINFQNCETINAFDFVHIHVIPKENRDLLYGNYACSGKGMEETWRAMIKDQSKYQIVSPSALLKPINSQKYGHLLEYLELRYW